MTSVTNFERNAAGQYSSIQQQIDGQDIPEGSVFVAFDSVQFARSTGQIAVVSVECNKVGKNGILIGTDNSDRRLSLGISLSNGNIVKRYTSLSPAMLKALEEKNAPTSDQERYLQVTQFIDVINDFKYIGNGAMDLTKTP